MTTARRRSAAIPAGSHVPVPDLRPGHVIGASGIRTIISEGTDHGAYRSFVVRYVNGEQRIESWPSDSTVLVVGTDRDVRRQNRRLRPA
ncbi:hypothetical protein JCM18899A_52320 [Nocardioides sp. AN3]